MNYRNSRNYDNLERRIFDGVGGVRHTADRANSL